MCFSLEASVTFAAIGLGTCGILLARGRPSWAWGLFLYFAVMEMLQAAQYMAMASDESASSHGSAGPMCMGAPGRGSMLNKTLMVASWVHICFQPWVVNR